LLGLAIERATGSTLDAYEREYIFAPAGMTHTSADTPVTGLPLAKGTRVPGDDGFAFDPSWFFGSGDLVSTADDLARFDIALTNGRLLRRASLERMSSGELQRTGYGLGLLQMRFAGTTLVGHSGGLPGFGGANMVSLSDGTAIVALGNSEGFDWQSTMIPLLTALYPQSLRERPARPVVSAKTAALLTGFVAGLQRGSIDRNELSKDFSAALDAPTLAAVAKEFSSYGSFRRLVFVARGHDGVLQYDGIFEHACYPFNFTIAPDGKLATY
jgi:CubicO group peptidase (beta-lactamase class C family)